MPADAPSSLYEQLAEKYHAKGKFPERDRFLILAADAAWNAGQPDSAEGFRRRILEHNPNHLLRPYSSFAEALKSADILAYVQQLRRGYPRDRALELLKELDVDPRFAKRGTSEPNLGLSPGGAALPPAPFKLAEAIPPNKGAPGPHPRSNVPPMLTTSQSMQNEPAQPGRAPQPAWQPQQAGAAPMPAEAGAGAAVGAFLFFVVAALSLGAVGWLFVMPLLK